MTAEPATKPEAVKPQKKGRTMEIRLPSGILREIEEVLKRHPVLNARVITDLVRTKAADAATKAISGQVGKIVADSLGNLS